MSRSLTNERALYPAHAPDGDRPWCATCGTTWPCGKILTASAADALSASGTEPDFTALPVGTPYDGSTIAEETDWDGSDTDMPIQYELADGRRVWIPLADYAKYRPAAPDLTWEERVERAHTPEVIRLLSDLCIEAYRRTRHNPAKQEATRRALYDAILRAAFPEYAPKD